MLNRFLMVTLSLVWFAREPIGNAIEQHRPSRQLSIRAGGGQVRSGVHMPCRAAPVRVPAQAVVSSFHCVEPHPVSLPEYRIASFRTLTYGPRLSTIFLLAFELQFGCLRRGSLPGRARSRPLSFMLSDCRRPNGVRNNRKPPRACPTSTAAGDPRPRHGHQRADRRRHHPDPGQHVRAVLRRRAEPANGALNDVARSVIHPQAGHCRA